MFRLRSFVLTLYGMIVLSLFGCIPVKQGSTPMVLKPLHYDLQIKLDYKEQKLFGQCEITIKNPTEQPVKTIPMILYRLLQVTDVSSAANLPIEYSQAVGSFSDFPQQQANFILIQLKKPLPSGDSTVIKLDYEGYLLGYTETGMLYVRDRIDREYTILRLDGLAYPVLGIDSYAANRAYGLQSYDYRIEVTVPSELTAANAGTLLSREESGGDTIYKYKSVLPSWRMDIAIAPYKILEDPSANFKIFYFEQDKAGADRIMGALHRALQLYTGWFGALEDFRGFTVIEVPEGTGSQTDVAAVLQTRDAFSGSEHLDAFYHEISHLWNPMAAESQPCRLESEGSAMFLQYLASEKLDGRQDAVMYGRERALERFRKAVSANPSYLTVPIIDYGRKSMTGLSYSKGLLFFNALYDLLGEEEFLRILGDFFSEYRRSGASTEEFLQFFDNRASLDLDVFYADWVLGTSSNQDIRQGIPWNDMIGKYSRNGG